MNSIVIERNDLKLKLQAETLLHLKTYALTFSFNLCSDPHEPIVHVFQANCDWEGVMTKQDFLGVSVEILKVRPATV